MHFNDDYGDNLEFKEKCTLKMFVVFLVLFYYIYWLLSKQMHFSDYLDFLWEKVVQNILELHLSHEFKWKHSLTLCANKQFVILVFTI